MTCSNILSACVKVLPVNYKSFSNLNKNVWNDNTCDHQVVSFLRIVIILMVVRALAKHANGMLDHLLP